jgi:hypothetical protein
MPYSYTSFFFFEKMVLAKVVNRLKSIRLQNSTVLRRLVQVLHQPHMFKRRRFGMVAATALKTVESRSPSMALSPY